jgi:hypothetical protein
MTRGITATATQTTTDVAMRSHHIVLPHLIKAAADRQSFQCVYPTLSSSGRAAGQAAHPCASIITYK